MTVEKRLRFVYNICISPKGGMFVSESKKPLGKAELLAAVDRVESISDLFALVQKEHIDIRMHSFSSASNLPPKMLDLTDTQVSPLEKLKIAVKSAVENTR